MKRIELKSKMTKLSAVLGLMFLSSTMLALGNNGNESLYAGDADIVETQRIIKQHISFSNNVVGATKTEKVEVVFTTDEMGKVNFVLAKTENELLKKQMEKQFSEMTLTKIKSNVAYSIVFNIKKI